MTPRQARLIRIVEREFALAPGAVTPHLRLADLGDSLDAFSLLNAIEDEFGTRIDDGIWLRMRSVADLLALVEEPVVP